MTVKNCQRRADRSRARLGRAVSPSPSTTGQG
jgi:hypothetical protein